MHQISGAQISNIKIKNNKENKINKDQGIVLIGGTSSGHPGWEFLYHYDCQRGTSFKAFNFLMLPKKIDVKHKSFNTSTY